MLPRTHLGTGSFMSALSFSRNSVPVHAANAEYVDADGWDSIAISDCDESRGSNFDIANIDADFDFLKSYIDSEKWDSHNELTESELDSEYYSEDEETLMHPMSKVEAMFDIDRESRRRQSLSPFSRSVDDYDSDVGNNDTTSDGLDTVFTSTPNPNVIKPTARSSALCNSMSAWSTPHLTVDLTREEQSDMANFVAKLHQAELSDHVVLNIDFPRKPHELLGFSFIGGPDNVITSHGFCGVYVTNLHVDGLASRDGRLQVGDRILEANGIVLHSEMDNAAIIKAFHSNTKVLSLTLTRPSTDKKSRYRVRRAGQDIVYVVETIELSHTKTSLGVILEGGVDQPSRSGGTRIVIAQLLAGGHASVDGRLQQGDIIVDVGGVGMSNVTHDFARKTFRQCSRTSYTLTIMRPCKYVKMTKPINASYGFQISGGTDKGSPIVVHKVTPHSEAATHGVQDNDEVVYCGNVDLRNCTHDDVLTLIGSGATDDSNSLELLLHASATTTPTPTAR